MPGVTGTARVDRRSTALIRRLRPGDIAVIEHVDLDRPTAEALAGAGVAAVVNAAASVSGRYPALGAGVLAAAGIPLVDVEASTLSRVSDGDRLRVHEGTVWHGDEQIAEGDLLGADRVVELTEHARSGLGARLEAFTLDSAEYLRREHELLLDDVGIPDLSTRVRGREVLVVSTVRDHRGDLRALRSFVKDRHPVLVGVDAGADALLQAGLTPDVVVGDLDAASETVLRCGAEMVAHRPRGGSPPARERLDTFGVEPLPFAVSGTAEDAALLLVDAGGADVIVLAGAHADLMDFLDRGRSAMASAFLTRLRVAPRLLDARTAARLHRSQLAPWHLVLLMLAAVLAVAVAVATTPVGQEWFGAGADAVTSVWDDTVTFVRGLT
jgi:uncharacterized membrane-anchored protein